MVWEWKDIFDKVHIGMPKEMKKTADSSDRVQVYTCEGTSLKVSCVLINKNIDIEKDIPKDVIDQSKRIIIIKTYKRTQGGTEQTLMQYKYDNSDEERYGTLFSCALDDKNLVVIAFEWDGELDRTRTERIMNSIVISK